MRNRVINAWEDGSPITLAEADNFAVERGGPDIAETAAVYLSDVLQGKVGSLPGEIQAVVCEIRWSTDGAIGRGSVDLFGERWGHVDYRDCLQPSEELARKLDIPEGQDEKRQCLAIHAPAVAIPARRLRQEPPPGGSVGGSQDATGGDEWVRVRVPGCLG